MKKIQKFPFTKDAYEKLLKKNEVLQQKRQEVLKRLQEAREMGDLSENGAYKYAKFEIGSINRQLRHTTFLLKNAEVTAPTKGDSIDFGSVVTLKSPNGTRTITLVSSHESNPAENKVSMHSPLGKKLMHKKAGDSITVHAPLGEIVYTIKKVGV